MMLIDEMAGKREIEAANWRNEWAGRCDRAAQLLEARPDEAALLLDGLLSDIARGWARQAAPLPVDESEDLLALIEQAAPLAGWRLRLALRAPDARARLAACRVLIDAIGE